MPRGARGNGEHCEEDTAETPRGLPSAQTEQSSHNMSCPCTATSGDTPTSCCAARRRGQPGEQPYTCPAQARTNQGHILYPRWPPAPSAHCPRTPRAPQVPSATVPHPAPSYRASPPHSQPPSPAARPGSPAWGGPAKVRRGAGKGARAPPHPCDPHRSCGKVTHYGATRPWHCSGGVTAWGIHSLRPRLASGAPSLGPGVGRGGILRNPLPEPRTHRLWGPSSQTGRWARSRCPHPASPGRGRGRCGASGETKGRRRRLPPQRRDAAAPGGP